MKKGAVTAAIFWLKTRQTRNGEMNPATEEAELMTPEMTPEAQRLIARGFERIGRALIRSWDSQGMSDAGQELLLIAGQLGAMSVPVVAEANSSGATEAGGDRRRELFATGGGTARREVRITTGPASPMWTARVKGIDGLSRTLAGVSLAPGQSLLLELPKEIDPRIRLEPTGTQILELRWPDSAA